MKYFPAILLLFVSFMAIGQDKVEKESRIKSSEVPRLAIDFIYKTYNDSVKVKWYLEESENGKSYEAKLKWNENRHSIEFNLEGHIEDIEINAKAESLPQNVLETVEEELTANFEKFKIRKIQIQYSGTSSQLSNAIKNLEYKNVLKKFEIVFEAKDENQLGLWEGLFDENGKIVSKRRIIEKPSNNLDF